MSRRILIACMLAMGDAAVVQNVDQGTGVNVTIRIYASSDCSGDPSNDDANIEYLNYWDSSLAPCTKLSETTSMRGQYCDMATIPPVYRVNFWSSSSTCEGDRDIAEGSWEMHDGWKSPGSSTHTVNQDAQGWCKDDVVGAKGGSSWGSSRRITCAANVYGSWAEGDWVTFNHRKYATEDCSDDPRLSTMTDSRLSSYDAYTFYLNKFTTTTQELDKCDMTTNPPTYRYKVPDPEDSSTTITLSQTADGRCDNKARIICEYRSPPPSPPPPSPPPPSQPTPEFKVTTSFTLGGVVDDYGAAQQTSIKRVLAAAASVSESAVTLALTSASVNVAADISVASQAAESTMTTTLTAGILANAASLETALTQQFTNDGLSTANLQVEAFTPPASTSAYLGSSGSCDPTTLMPTSYGACESAATALGREMDDTTGFNDNAMNAPTCAWLDNGGNGPVRWNADGTTASSFGGPWKAVCVPAPSSSVSVISQDGDGDGDGGGGGGGGDDDPCFSSSAMVTRANGTPSRIDALKAGDAIVAATADGALTTDTVSLLSIAKPAAQATFLTLTTAANATLTLTPMHHLPTGAACCTTLKQAKDIAVGDTVWAVTGGAATATTVREISKASKQGLHSPVLLNGGFPVVDGLVTSFDSIEKVTLAKYALAPLLGACKATGTCETFLALFQGEDQN